MKSLNTYYDLITSLGFGKANAKHSKQLYQEYLRVVSSVDEAPPISTFQRRLRDLSSQARLNGIKVIGDDYGYYIAVTRHEWEEFKAKRFTSISSEIKSFANCEKLTLSDFISNIWNANNEERNKKLL